MRTPTFFSSPRSSCTPICTADDLPQEQIRKPDTPTSSSLLARRKAPLLAALCSALILIAGCGSPLATSGTSSLVANPATVDFGSVVVGQTATSKVQFQNPNSSPLTVSSISVTGHGFSLAAQPTLPFTLAANQSTTVSVKFAPTTTGATSGMLTLTSDTSKGKGHDNKISLHGNGKAKGQSSGTLSSLNCSSSSVTGAASVSCSVSLTAAAGSGGLAVALSSSSASVSVPASVTVAAGATSASFTANASTVSSAQTVTLTASAGGVSKTFSLQLNAATAAIVVSPSSITFGNETIAKSTSQTLTISSNGNAALTVNSASISGTGFSMSGASFPVTLNPGQSVSLQITFNPPAASSYSGTVTISSNASSGGTTTVQLSGSGVSTAYTVQLTWAAPTSSTDPIAGYDVYRATGTSTSYQLMNSTPDTSTTYKDSSVADGKTYVYYVVSVDSSGKESSPSNTFSAAIP